MLNDQFKLTNLLQDYKNITDLGAIVSKGDLKGKITYVNDKFCKISEYSKEELIGENHNIIRHPDVSKEIYKELWSTIQDKKTWVGRVKNKSKTGKIYYVDVLVSPILDKFNEIKEYISIRYEITDIIDDKKLLLDDIKDAKAPLLVVLQIDNYKNLKKFYRSDKLTKLKNELTKRIISISPECLVINKIYKLYKLSNGKFAFFKDLKDEVLDYNKLRKCLKLFLKNLHKEDLEVEDFYYDIPVVLAYSTRKENTYENTIASLNKIQEKNNNFICSDDDYISKEKKYIHNMNIISLLKNSLINNKIKSFYQPIVCNKTKSIIKYESLVRIESNTEILTPNLFLDIAKNGKYYHHITNRVLFNTFKDLRKIKMQISINISSLDIENHNFRLNFTKLLKENRDINHRLTVEILEDENISYINELESFIVEIKNYGVKIAVDDFGVGYSNFSRLKIFKPDFIKIDGSLIKDIENDKYSLDLVKSIHNFCKNQNIKTIAEFVSNENIFNIINEIGIDYSQGYYFGKPETLADIKINVS